MKENAFKKLFFSVWSSSVILVIVLLYAFLYPEFHIFLVRKVYSTPEAMESLIPSKEEVTTPEIFTPTGKIHLITVATSLKERKIWLCNLSRSVQYFGGMLNVLGFNNKPEFFAGALPNDTFLKRVIMYSWSQQVKNIRIPHFIANAEKVGIANDDLVVIVDAFDTLLQRNLSELIPKFSQILKNRRGIILGAEKYCWPFNFKISRYTKYYFRNRSDPDVLESKRGYEMCEYLKKFSPEKKLSPDGSFKFINSGGIIGDFKSIKNYYKKVQKLAYYLYDDQEIAALIFAQYPGLNIHVDTVGDIFMSMLNLSASDAARVVDKRSRDCLRTKFLNKSVSEGKFSKPKNVKFPFFLHFNGGPMVKKYLSTCFQNVFEEEFKTLTGEFLLKDLDGKQSIKSEELC